MADTPILNYKGKYDGPEIDKAVELALGLENPESCPYYVHISLRQPDYVLTIGLGDAEGNLFNHAEIDLPLESMVVNATYENGNIILHLQDGTSTEPIPISALIAGLVSETRTIAGIDLKDDITPKELRDALGVYTKDSVDQLVSDLENRIDETLNEMEQSLNDLSDLTLEHDMQIKKNTSDISVNHATLGIQCKNELIIVQKSLSNYKGINIIVNDDKSIIITGTPTESVYLGIGSFHPKKTGKYILSGCPTGGGFNSHVLYFPQIQKYDVGNSITIDITSTETLTVNILVKNGVEHNLTFYPMIRPADITDPTYEPYVPSINDRVTANEKSTIINQSTIGFQSKNILPNTKPSIEYEGITYTVNTDKSITCNGTTGSTASYFSLNSIFTELPNNVDMVFSGCPADGSANTYALQLYEDATPNARIHWNDYGGGITGKLPKTNNGKYKGMIVIRANQTVENLTFKPMLRYAGTDDTYEPYVPTVNERIIEAENNILSNTVTIEKIGLKAGSSAAVHLSAVGWYRAFIAERKQTVRSGILMLNRAFNAAAPESYTILFNLTHSNSIFRLLSKNIEGQGITKIRLVYSNTTPQLSPCYIDIYYNSTSGNTMTASVYCESIAATGTGSTFANSRFVVSDFSVAEIPEGYKAVEFDLTGKDVFERLTALETALTQTTE